MFRFKQSTEGIRPFPGKLIDRILGADPDHSPSPERLRNEHLTGIIVSVSALATAAFVFDLLTGLDAFSWTLAAIDLVLLSSLFLIGRGYLAVGIDVAFFGCALALSAVFLVASADSRLRLYLLPVVDVMLFALIIVYGLYAKGKGKIFALFLVVFLFDAASFAVFGNATRYDVFSRISVLILHVIAFDLAGFFRAYTERLNRVAEARRIMNRRLEELVAEVRNAGTERLASLSHDIRSPVTGILGVYDLLLSTELDPEQKKYLDILGKSNRLLLEIVESILDRDEEQGSLVPGCGSSRACIDGALTPYRSLARSKGLELRRRIVGTPPPIPLPRADAARLIGNLVDNSLKYTDSGRILVSFCEIASGGVSLVVSDTGKGMSAERLAAVRAGIAGPDAAVASSCGLGLQSVRRIVARAGAEMHIESAPGKGTKVTIRFPLPEGVPSGILASAVSDSTDIR